MFVFPPCSKEPGLPNVSGIYVTDKTQQYHNNLHADLKQLMAEACTFPRKSFERRQRLTLVVQWVQQSGKLWFEKTPYYEDALQQTWLYICRNPEKYDPERAEVIAWINSYLNYRLQDQRILHWKEQKQKAVPPVNSKEDPIDTLSADPPVPPILQETLQWIQADPNKKLSQAHLKAHCHINCQALLLRRFPPETPWDKIAEEFNLSSTAGVTTLYHRRCLSLLREFGEQQGYLNRKS
jgi:hypothetical protein